MNSILNGTQGPRPRESGRDLTRYSFREFMEMGASFHGHPSPGIAIGGYMVNLAMSHIPEGTLYDIICETDKCIPDAVQLLTPCTAGKGWMKVINIGRFALTLYDKETGEGIRVFIDHEKIRAYPEIETWFFKLKKKKDQNTALLMEQIRSAGSTICGMSRVRLNPGCFMKKAKEPVVICPECGESHPESDGAVCRDYP